MYVLKFIYGDILTITHLMPQYSSHGTIRDPTNYRQQVCNVVEEGVYTPYLINSDEELAKVIIFFGLKKLPE